MSNFKPIKVIIHNYQSIDSLELEIAGFTCITGSTNIGKSAIIRAISSALLNNPVVGMVRKGERFCTVDMRGESWGIKWEKGSQVNRYWLPGKDRPLDKIGQGQSEATIELGFRSIRVGKDNIQPWYAPQFHPIFLMDKSGPAITDFISEVTRLKVLQDSIIINNRNRRRLLEKVKVREEDLEKVRTKEAALEQLPNVLQAEKELRAQLDSINDYNVKIRQLEDWTQQINTANHLITLLEHVSTVKIPEDKVKKQIDNIVKMAEYLSQLESVAKSIISIKPISKYEIPKDEVKQELQKLEKGRKFLDIYRLQASVDMLEKISDIQIQNPKLSKDLEKLSKLGELYKNIQVAQASLSVLDKPKPKIPETPEAPGKLYELAKLSAAWDQVNTEIKSFEARHQELKAELGTVEEELAKIPTCPTCKQALPAPTHLH